jgi:hypothetical protein
MVSITIIGVATVLAAVAIVAKKHTGRRPKVSKSEKGEILKQLLALSAQENNVSSIPSPPAGSRRLPSPQRIDTSQKRPSPKPKTEAVAVPRDRKPSVSQKPNQTDTEVEELIRQRAYELYQKHGEVDGNATDHWLQAKKDVLKHKTQRHGLI